MEKIASFLSNTILATFLLVLILIPVGIVGGIGGIGPKPQKGVALGARLDEQGGTLSEVREGEIKELSFTTFWGSQATYKNILSIKNRGGSEKEYQLEILEVSGTETEEQDVLVYFQENGMQKIKLEPGEEAWINLEVATPPSTGLPSTELGTGRAGSNRTQSSLILAIWEH